MRQHSQSLWILMTSCLCLGLSSLANTADSETTTINADQKTHALASVAVSSTQQAPLSYHLLGKIPATALTPKELSAIDGKSLLTHELTHMLTSSSGYLNSKAQPDWRYVVTR